MPEAPRDLRKARRQSARAIPATAGLLVALAVAWWLAGRFVAVPIWLAVLVLGPVAFTLAGDLVNIAVCNWRLRGREDA